TKISTTLGDTGGGSPTAHGWSTLSRYLLPLLLALSWSESGEQEKVFSSTKRTVTSSTKGKGKAKAPRGRCQEEEPVSEEEEDNSSMASETDNEKGQDTKPPRKRKKLDKLHEHLSDLVKIFATDLHPRWLTYNYHIVLHIADQIRLHGPPRAYWAYPSERLYGLMKQIKTNRHRNGQIEFSLISRTDDRHRVATALENLPPLPLVTTMRAIIKGESRQGAKTMDDETDQGFTSSRTAKPMRLTLPQLAAVCSIANRSRPADSQPLIPLAASTPGRRENVANNMATRLNRIDHSFFEEAAQTMIHNTYAQIKVLQHQDWPDRHLFSDSMWTELGYMLATRDDPQDAVISVEDIASVALTGKQTTIPHRSKVIQIKTTNPFNTANASTITQTSICAVTIITTVTVVVKFVTVTVIATVFAVTVIVVTVINPPFAKQVLALSTPFPTLAKVIVVKIVVVPWFHIFNPSLSIPRVHTTNIPIPCVFLTVRSGGITRTEVFPIRSSRRTPVDRDRTSPCRWRIDHGEVASLEVEWTGVIGHVTTNVRMLGSIFRTDHPATDGGWKAKVGRLAEDVEATANRMRTQTLPVVVHPLHNVEQLERAPLQEHRTDDHTLATVVRLHLHFLR
ncbi:unnamed protein product, partial [Tilletia caries]